MDSLRQDVRYALAMLRRGRGFAAAGLLTLALGIGATTAVFSVVYGVLLKPLPYPAAERLVNLSEERPGVASPLPVPLLSNLTYHAWTDASTTLDAVAAYSGRQYTIELPDGVARIEGAAVTPALFGLLGMAPAVGRFFAAADARTGADAVLVLSDRLWRERFHAQPDVVGRSVVVDGKPYAVVGVAPSGFAFPARDTMLWTPYLVAAPAEGTVAGGRGAMSVLRAIGRLKAGATTAQAAAEGSAAARRYPRPIADQLLFGAGTTPTIVQVRTMRDEMTAAIRPALVVLAAAVVLVLLIACANVANLFLSRGVARRRELTVRAAIGASRLRLIRQTLTESLVVSVLGGALGLGLAKLLVGVGPAFATRNFPRLDDIAIDARAVAFTAIATLLTTVLCGLAPALRAGRVDLNDALHGGDGATAGGFRGVGGRRLRQGLLAAEAALAVVLVIGAMLLGRSFVNITRVDAGYTAENVLTAEVFVPGYDAATVLSPSGAAKAEHIASLVETVLDRLRHTGGVVAAGAGTMMPLDRTTQIAGFPAPWTAPGATPVTARALQYTVTPGYAEALGLRLKAGRFFTESDRSSGVRAWIVNEEFARHYLPPNPAGYRFEQHPDSGPITVEVIGIVGNVLKNGNDSKPQPEYYRVPRDQTRFDRRFEIAIRTAGDPTLVAPAVRSLIRELEPSAAVETASLATRVQASVEQPRFTMFVLAAFATIALALASIGLYGVLSYGVAQRRREMGVRAALGAARRDLVRLVIAEGLAVTAFGVVVGLIAAAAVTRLMRTVLFGVAPVDAASFIIAPLVLLAVALLASWLPARRAAAIDPAEALRYE